MDELRRQDESADVDLGARIVGAALDEVLAARASDALAFLTPGLLSDAARGAERAWSAGTVRYRFRRDGLAFDRDALAAALADESLERVGHWMECWALRTAEEVLDAGSRGGEDSAERALAAGLRQLAAASRRLARGSAPGVWLVVGIVMHDPQDGPPARGILERAQSCARQVTLACAVACGYEPLDDAGLASLGASAIRRAIIIGLTSASDTVEAGIDEAAARLMGGLTSPAGDRELSGLAVGHAPARPGESDDEAVVRTVRMLDVLGVSSSRFPAALEELVAALPASSWAFAHGRRYLEALVQRPELHHSERGQRAWRVASEVLSMASGNRQLADAVASDALLDPVLDKGVSGPRPGWLLLRLERFEEAELYLDRVRRQAWRIGDRDAFALALSFSAYGTGLTGPLDRALALAAEVRELAATGSAIDLAVDIADAVAIRALLLIGDDAGATSRLAQSEGRAEAGTSLGATMVQIARAWQLLGIDRPDRALTELEAVRVRLKALHVDNPAGWPTLEPTVLALCALARPRDARRLIGIAEPAAASWGTPLVLAAVQLAAAHAALDDVRARHLLEAARAILIRSPARVARDRADLMLAALTGETADALPDSDLSPSSVLVRVGPRVRHPPTELTPRVRAVAEMVATGMRNKEIAAELGVTVSTVSRHVTAAMRATGTGSRTQLALLAAGWRRP